MCHLCYLFKTGQANEVLSQIHAHVRAHAHDLFLGSFFFFSAQKRIGNRQHGSSFKSMFD